MTDRIPLDDMTSDQLDALYAELDRIHRYREQLAAELTKARTADRAHQCPAELRISPHNGIASGLETALHLLDRHLDGQEQPHA